MTNKLKKGNWNAGTVKMFLWSMLTAIVSAAILIVIAAVLLDKMNLSEKGMRLSVYIIYICSALAAGLIAGKWKREKKFMWGALTGIVWLVVIFVTSLISNGAILEVKELFPAVVCMVGGGMLGGMLA